MMKRLRRSRDLGINGFVARWYNNNTRNHRMEEMKGYAREVARHIQDGDSVLEVAPGPGYLSIELAKMGNYKVTDMDISQDFVEIARNNAREAGVQVDFQQGNAADMPFLDNGFNFIVCSAAFKNFKEPLKALNEMHRVLKPGGTALIIDMNRNVSDQQIDASIKEMGERGIGALFMKLTFKYFLKRGAYTKDELISLISKTEFSNYDIKYDIKEEGVGFYIYLRK